MKKKQELRDRYVWHDGKMPSGCALEKAKFGNKTIDIPNSACSTCKTLEGKFSQDFWQSNKIRNNKILFIRKSNGDGFGLSK